MISKSEILEMVNSILKSDGGRMQHPVVEPKREWMIGIGLFLIVLIGGGLYTAHKYKYYSNIESTVETTTKTHKKYDQNSADIALNIFESRHQKFNAIVETQLKSETYNASSTKSGTSTAVGGDDLENEKEPVATNATSSDSVEE